MKISDVLRTKGNEVVTIRPDDTVAHLLTVLAEHEIGALVVSGDGKAVDGIVSERDVVRHLHSSGPHTISGPVSAIMTSEVTTCEPNELIEALGQLMTDQRIRHVPVVRDNELYAIVSIGDVVKQRINMLQSERDHLASYVQQSAT